MLDWRQPALTSSLGTRSATMMTNCELRIAKDTKNGMTTISTNRQRARLVPWPTDTKRDRQGLRHGDRMSRATGAWTILGFGRRRKPSQVEMPISNSPYRLRLD